MSELG